MNAPDLSRHLSQPARDASVQHFLAPLDHLLADPTITEIAVNEPRRVWYERNSVWDCVDSPAADTQWIKSLATAVGTLTNQAITAETPLLGAALPDGSRLQFAGPPAVEEDRWSMTLRKPSRRVMRLDELEAGGLFDEVRPYQNGVSEADQGLVQLLKEGKHREFCKRAVLARKNIVVCGATGSGKTTFMKSLVAEIPHEERLITIEDVRELFVPHPNAVHLLYSKGGQSIAKGLTAKSLLECCLRMKPHRILVAELRAEECLYYVRSAASGHPGSITSCHAGSPALAYEQMAIMIQDSPGGANLTFDVIKRLLTLTIDVVIQFQCHHNKRFISEIYFDPAKQLEASR